MLRRKIAVVIIKVDSIQMDYLRIQLRFNLLRKILDGIPVEEARLSGVVAVEIEIEEKPLVSVIVIKEFSDSVNSWLLEVIVLVIITIQILVVNIHSVVTMVNPIWIDHGDYLKHKQISQLLGSCIISKI